jgi:hypothetical protein
MEPCSSGISVAETIVMDNGCRKYLANLSMARFDAVQAASKPDAKMNLTFIS